eukprot:SAG11_NODE_994_length_6261_cov_10.558747_6_plen_171_part_00
MILAFWVRFAWTNTMSSSIDLLISSARSHLSLRCLQILANLVFYGTRAASRVAQSSDSISSFSMRCRSEFIYFLSLNLEQICCRKGGRLNYEGLFYLLSPCCHLISPRSPLSALSALSSPFRLSPSPLSSCIFLSVQYLSIICPPFCLPFPVSCLLFSVFCSLCHFPSLC